ncbi:ECs_2282 family putative zinc-binding protein [Citrobacter freundii]
MIGAGMFSHARRVISCYSPTARIRLIFILPNRRKDIFMQENQTLKVACPDCGSELLKRPDDFDFENNFVDVTCADCGREISKSDVIDQATDTVKSKINDMLRNSLKGTGWKFK